MRSSLLPAGLFLLLSVHPAYPQTNEQTQHQGRIAGTVINAEQEPIRKAIICETVRRPHSDSTNCGVAQTDENGRFEIANVELGELGLSAENQEAGYWNEDFSAAQKVTLTPEEPVANVILNVGARPAELRIGVKDKDTGKPVQSCTIQSIQGNHTFINREMATAVLRLRPAMDAMIQVSAPGYKNWYYINPSDPSQPVLRLRAGEQKSLDVELIAKPADASSEQ